MHCNGFFCTSIWALNPNKFVWFILGFSTYDEIVPLEACHLNRFFGVSSYKFQYSKSKVSEVVSMINLSCLHQNTVLVLKF